jgi:hypothetical protein
MVDYATAKRKRDAFMARGPQRAEVYVRPNSGVVYRPTPTRFEVIPNAVEIGQIKLWDLSPLYPHAFDLFEPPSGPVEPPVVAPTTFVEVLADVVLPEVLGTCTATNSPTGWAIVDNAGLDLRMSGASGQLVLASLVGAAIGDFAVVVAAANAVAAGQGPITVRFT